MGPLAARAGEQKNAEEELKQPALKQPTVGLRSHMFSHQRQWDLWAHMGHIQVQRRQTQVDPRKEIPLSLSLFRWSNKEKSLKKVKLSLLLLGVLVLRAFVLFVVFHSWPLCFGLKNVSPLLMSLGKHEVRIRWLQYAHCEALLHSAFSLILHRNPWQPTVSPHPIRITLITTTPLRVLCMLYSEGYWTGEGGVSGDAGMTKSCRIVQHSRSRCTMIFSCQLLEARDSLTTYSDSHVLFLQLWEMHFTAKSLGFE